MLLNLRPGDKFNKLTILDAPPRRLKKTGNFQVLCRCDCGTEKWIRGSAVKTGATKSCGCLGWQGVIGKALLIKKLTTHGLSRTRLYQTWKHMMQRCYDPKNTAYHNYGGRGILVDQRWHDLNNFVEDIGHAPTTKHTLERKNNSLGYSKGNCCYATQEEQSNNTRWNKRITHNGTTLTIAQWSRKVGLSIPTLWARLNTLRWSIEKSLTAPLAKNKSRKIMRNHG